MNDASPYTALRPTEDEVLEAWRALIIAEGEQVARVRDSEPDADFYAPVAGRFRPGVRESVERLHGILERREHLEFDAGLARVT